MHLSNPYQLLLIRLPLWTSPKNKYHYSNISVVTKQASVLLLYFPLEIWGAFLHENSRHYQYIPSLLRKLQKWWFCVPNTNFRTLTPQSLGVWRIGWWELVAAGGTQNQVREEFWGKGMSHISPTPTLIFFLRFHSFIFKEGGREGEKHQEERETSINCLLYMLQLWPNPQSRHVPQPGIKPGSSFALWDNAQPT